MVKYVLAIIVLFTTIIHGLGNDQKNEQVMAIPDDVSYSVIKESTVHNFIINRRTLTVRLNKEMSKTTLRALALKLKSQDSRNYDQTFMMYYLPGMKVGTIAWATTHFNPNLEVVIMGFTIEEKKKLLNERAPEDCYVIGRWLDETPYLGSRITIFRKDGLLFIEHVFADGSSSKERIKERAVLMRIKRFEPAEASRYGEHWILNANGNLEVHDNKGLISTAKRID